MSIDINKEFEHIKPLVSEDTTPEQLYIFSLRMCNNDIDADNDKLSDDFLRQFAEQINTSSIPLIKDHTWTADGQIGRVYRAEVLSDGVNSLGEPYTYVLGYAYVAADSDIVSRIKLGLLSEVSVGFDGSGYTCSVCGAGVKSHDCQCTNGHVFGTEYEGNPVYRNVNQCLSALECSFVPVPAQDGAEIQSKSKEGRRVKISEFRKILGLKSKKAEDEVTEVAVDEAPATDEEETKAEETPAETEAEETPAEEEVKEETPAEEDDPEVTIADLVSAIADLKQAVDELKAAKNESVPVKEEVEETKTKARKPYVLERPVVQTGIKARVNQAGSDRAVKSRTPYVVEHTI
jgi:hypothetical protein